MKSELFAAYSAIFAGIVTGFLGCYGIQQYLNNQTVKNCSLSIHRIAYSNTGFGPTVHCVSRAAVYGPALPLKD